MNHVYHYRRHLLKNLFVEKKKHTIYMQLWMMTWPNSMQWLVESDRFDSILEYKTVSFIAVRRTETWIDSFIAFEFLKWTENYNDLTSTQIVRAQSHLWVRAQCIWNMYEKMPIDFKIFPFILHKRYARRHTKLFFLSHFISFFFWAKRYFNQNYVNIWNL